MMFELGDVKGQCKTLMVGILHVCAVVSLLCAVSVWGESTETVMQQQVIALWQIKALLWAVVFEMLAGAVHREGR